MSLIHLFKPSVFSLKLAACSFSANKIRHFLTFNINNRYDSPGSPFFGVMSSGSSFRQPAMFPHRFFTVLLFFLLFLAPARSADVEYVWRGADYQWGSLSNWSVGSVAASSAPGAAASAYEHWMVTNGTDSAGRTDVGGLGAGGRYLKGVRIAGLNSQPEGKIPLFIKNTNKDVYLRVEKGGITVENAGEGGYSADFGVAQPRTRSGMWLKGAACMWGMTMTLRPGDCIP